MSGKRGDPVERPDPWEFVFGDLKAAKGWETLRRAAPGPLDHAWMAITSDPTRTDGRQHQLKGNLGTGTVEGVSLPQWQYEVTGGGRLWYLVDAKNRRLYLSHAGTGHPKATDKGVRRGKP